MITVSLDENTLERGLQAARKSFSCADNPAFRKTLVEAGVAGIVNALRKHFREREREPENRFGFPKFGQSYPKRYFWYGTRGTSVAERIRIVRTSPAALDGQVAVNSPALAHKLSTNPPPIVPKGGRKYLAIPASPEAAGWSGRPRDFPGGLRLAFSRVPGSGDRWLPSLVSATQKGAVSGSPQYWLVRKVLTRHDPQALPSNAALQDAAVSAIRSTVSRRTS
mgnify:FL=1